MTEPAYQTTTAFHELLDLLRDADQSFLTGFRAVGDEVSVVEGYRWLTEVLAVALECYLWSDPARPSIVPLVSPTRKFGGDNADAAYCFAALDPRRDYVVRGKRGNAVYFSLTVYGGPDDGRWSSRIVATLNDRDMQIAPDGSFEIVLSAREHDGNWLRLEDDAVCLVTRDYFIEPMHTQPVQWEIRTTGSVDPPRLSDVEVARRLRAATNFLRDLTALCPLPFDDSKWNTVDDPYPVPQVTYGWAAGDASYAMGAYSLEEGQALVIEGRSPKCAFWNLVLWNPYLQTYDYRYERVSINGHQITYEPDGSWRVVIAARDPGLSPNWISTAGHTRGRIWFRWFLPEAMPERPVARVVG